jgi:hypothetical protein
MIRPGWDRFTRDQAAKIAPVLCHDDAILCDAPLDHNVILFSAAANMEWVDGLVPASCIEAHGELGRKAFVDEELHPAVRSQGRPPGRPTRGCVRA